MGGAIPLRLLHFQLHFLSKVGDARLLQAGRFQQFDIQGSGAQTAAHSQTMHQHRENKMSKKRFHCQSVIHAGSKSISITDVAHHFCITLEDAGKRLNFLNEAIAAGKYPVAIELVNSCPKLITGATEKYRVNEHNAKQFLHSLEKALSH